MKGAARRRRLGPCDKRRTPGCDPNVDDVWACIRRAGGISRERSGPLLGELRHAFGGAKQLPKGIIAPPGRGMSDSQVASLLHSQGYVLPGVDPASEQYDEGAATEFLTRCAHGWGGCHASPELNECQAQKAWQEEQQDG